MTAVLNSNNQPLRQQATMARASGLAKRGVKTAVDSLPGSNSPVSTDVEQIGPYELIGKELGRGTFGLVVPGRERATGRYFALKVSADLSDRESFLTELRVMQSLS